VADALAPDAAEWLRAALRRIEAGGEDDAALVIEDGGERVGAVRWQRANTRSRIASIHGLAVAPAARGRGVAVAAVRLLVADLLGPLGFHRVEAETYGFNEAGARAFLAAGFTREGARRRAWWRHGAWQDGLLFGLVADDPGAPGASGGVAQPPGSAT